MKTISLALTVLYIEPPFLFILYSGDRHLRQRQVKTVESWRDGAKTELTISKLFLCIWWDWQGITYYELTPYVQTLNSNLCCQQLDRLKAVIVQKRPVLTNRRCVVFNHDNARPHTTLVTGQKLLERGLVFLMHSPYSLDLTVISTSIFVCLWRMIFLVKIRLKRSL